MKDNENNTFLELLGVSTTFFVLLGVSLFLGVSAFFAGVLTSGVAAIAFGEVLGEVLAPEFSLTKGASLSLLWSTLLGVCSLFVSSAIALRSKLFFKRFDGVLSIWLKLTSDTLGVAPFLTGVEGGRVLSRSKNENMYCWIPYYYGTFLVKI